MKSIKLSVQSQLDESVSYELSKWYITRETQCLTIKLWQFTKKNGNRLYCLGRVYGTPITNKSESGKWCIFEIVFWFCNVSRWSIVYSINSSTSVNLSIVWTSRIVGFCICYTYIFSINYISSCSLHFIIPSIPTI